MREYTQPRIGFCLLAGALAGFVNGFFGAGGGMLLVPLLIWLCRLEDKAAFSSAIAVILPLCIVSIVIYALHDSLPVSDALPYLIGGAADALAGLVTWATFDNNAADAVASPFGSGCSSVVAQAVQENRNGGRRCFLGLFDPSVRPWVEPDVLSFVVPMSRFREMCGMMRASCLFDTHAWSKVRERINNDN